MMLKAVLCVVLALASVCTDAAGTRCPFRDHGVAEVNYDHVKADILAMLTNSHDFWPADFGNYGPFFIRLAWHCSGSYRYSDGRGGCDGGRIRFNPERSWADNTNLDKALMLLQPIKLKYGPSLSWGDLVILAGNTAIESMGAPVLGFCGGRIDDPDGYDSLELGPSAEQEAVAACPVNGDCQFPLGPTTVGLIYVNPEGHMGVPEPEGSVPDIRSSFGRMGMSDKETVALIGGGHAFGKAHGACPTGPGPNPTEDPVHPWPGTCGRGSMMGKGENTFTSGFEGSWTTAPTTWTNQFFTNLLDYTWSSHIGPGGHNQWQPSNESGSVPDIMMLTSDIALLHDNSYRAAVDEYAADIGKLGDDFAKVWYKLTTGDMGPVERCRGNNVPPAQPFQNPLPPAPATLPNFDEVRGLIRRAIYTDFSALLQPDWVHGWPYYGALFTNLAWRCASTFRATDYKGGCNGAKIRFSPERDWPLNVATNQALSILRIVKDQFGDNLTWADLIVLAGQTALEEAGASFSEGSFCGGRSDAYDGEGVAQLAPREYPSVFTAVRDNMKVMGLTAREMVALAGRLRSPTQQVRLGFSGSYTDNPALLSNAFYVSLLWNTWEPVSEHEYNAVGYPDVFALASDLVLIWDPEFKAIVQEYAADEQIFKDEFVAAWTKLMNSDRFDGACSEYY